MNTAPESPVDLDAFVADFASGWTRPAPHAWDHLLAVDIVLHQPLLPPISGRAAFAAEYARLLRLVPDLRGQVLSRAARGNTLFLELRLQGTLGRRPLSLFLVDRLTLDSSGRVRERRGTPRP